MYPALINEAHCFYFFYLKLNDALFVIHGILSSSGSWYNLHEHELVQVSVSVDSTLRISVVLKLESQSYIDYGVLIVMILFDWSLEPNLFNPDLDNNSSCV